MLHTEGNNSGTSAKERDNFENDPHGLGVLIWEMCRHEEIEPC